MDSQFFCALAVFLTLGVVLVNGSTDAPNAISSAVSTGALKMWQACLLCGACNFGSIIIFCLISHSVADTVFSMVSFKGESESLAAIAAVMITTIIFGIVTSRFGMPSSESHAMLSALFGASCFFGGRVDWWGLGAIMLYAIISCLVALLLSFLLFILLKKVRLKSRGWLILSTCLFSVMHGAQDGQKFVGILMLFLAKSYTPPHLFNNFTIILLVSVFMLLGSLICGKRITKSLGKDTVHLNRHSGFVADLGGFFALAICSLSGMPVSTGNVKTCSLIGVGLAEGEHINKKTVARIFVTSLATVPICFVAGFILTRIIWCFF